MNRILLITMFVVGTGLLLGGCDREEKYDNSLGSFSGNGNSGYSTNMDAMHTSDSVMGTYKAGSGGFSVGSSGYGAPANVKHKAEDDDSWFDWW